MKHTIQQMKMYPKRLLLGLLMLILAACKRDKISIPDPIPTSPTIRNTLIAGGGTASLQRIIGGDLIDALYSVKQTPDGGYIACGFTENDGASERDIFLIRTDVYGRTLWFRKFSDLFSDEGKFVSLTDDHGFIITGTANVAASGSFNHDYAGKLIKTDSNGVQVWNHSFSPGKYNSLNTVLQTSDGGYLMGGTEFYSNNGFLIKTDPAGIQLWIKSFGPDVMLYDVNETHDHGFIFCGSIRNAGTSRKDLYIVRTNTTGDTLWTKTYGNANDNTATAIKETPTGNFILCGYSMIPGGAGYAKLVDSAGGQIWHSDFDTLDVHVMDDIHITHDNQFIAVGRNGLASTNKAFLQKIDAGGNHVWIQWYHPKPYTLFNEVQPTADHGFIMAGYTTGEGYLVKTDANGN